MDLKFNKNQLPALTSSDVGLGNVPNVATNNQAPTFTQAGTRTNIASGETVSTLFGKVMKWFADLKSVAFSGSYADLTDKPASLPANGGNADTATKLATSRTIAISGGATGTATGFDGTGNISIPVTALDATKLSGMVPIGSIPAGALDRLVVVANDTARFALTTANVQLGDTVKVTASGKMYYVTDESKLNVEAGYEVYTAGAATSVPWGGVTDKPSTFPPAAHTHTSSEVGLGNVPNVTTNNQAPTFTQAGSRTNIASGDTMATLFGKIMKWFADLKTVAFTGSYSDLTDKPSTFTPAAHTHTSSEVGLGNVPNVTTNNQAPTFTQAENRTNLVSGDTMATLFGKIMKWFADLKTVAFTGSYADLTNKPTVTALYEMDLSTQCDGAKTAFSLSEALPGYYAVYLNGQRLARVSNFSISGTTLTLTTTAPPSGSVLIVEYAK